MKILKKNTERSRYYAGITRIAAGMTFVILALVTVGTVLSSANYDLTGPGDPQYIAAAVMALAGPLMTIGGGFLIGLAASRRGGSKTERTVTAGTYALLTYAAYIPLTGLLSSILGRINEDIPTQIVLYGPLITLVATGVFAFVVKKTSTRVSKVLSGTFVGAFWFSIAWNTISVFSLITEKSGSGFTSYPLGLSMPQLLLAPAIAFVVFYAVLKPLGKLGRVFYATYLTSLVYYFTMLLWSFMWNMDMNVMDALVKSGLVAGIVLMGVLTAAVLRTRRHPHGA